MANNQWNNRIKGSGVANPEDLLANPDNWRIHPKQQQDALNSVLRNVGWVQNIIVNEQTGHVVDGHMRVMLALREGATEVPVTYVDLSPDEEALVLATMDPIGAMAATDKAKLDELMDGLSVSDADLEALLNEVTKEYGGSTAKQVEFIGGSQPVIGGAEGGVPQSAVRMVQLYLTTGTQPDFMAWCSDLAKAYGTSNLTDTVFEAVKRAHDTSH